MPRGVAQTFLSAKKKSVLKCGKQITFAAEDNKFKDKSQLQTYKSSILCFHKLTDDIQDGLGFTNVFTVLKG